MTRTYRLEYLHDPVSVTKEANSQSLKRVTEESLIGILRSPQSHDWTVHGLGFLRLYLSDMQRLHIWDRSLYTPNATRIHDHPWHFDSWLVRGRLINRRFMLVPGPGSYRVEIGSSEVRVARPYSKQLLICGAGGCILEAPESVFLVEQAIEVLMSDGGFPAFENFTTYSQSKEQIHSSEAEDGTVTVIHRRFEGDPGRAHVYYPHDENFVSAEFRAATAEDVGRVTQNALNRWFPEVEACPKISLGGFS